MTKESRNEWREYWKTLPDDKRLEVGKNQVAKELQTFHKDLHRGGALDLALKYLERAEAEAKYWNLYSQEFSDYCTEARAIIARMNSHEFPEYMRSWFFGNSVPSWGEPPYARG